MLANAFAALERAQLIVISSRAHLATKLQLRSQSERKWAPKWSRAHPVKGSSGGSTKPAPWRTCDKFLSWSTHPINPDAPNLAFWGLDRIGSISVLLICQITNAASDARPLKVLSGLEP